MPKAIRLTDAEGRSGLYVPITENGRTRIFLRRLAAETSK